MRSLHLLAIAVAIYANALMARTEGMIQVRIFGIDGHSFPRWGVWLVHSWGFLCFYGGSFLLIKAYSEGWAKTIEILGKKTKIDDTNRWIVLRGLWWTCIGLVSSLGLILIPSKHLAVDHVEVGVAFVIGILTSFLPAIWSLRAMKSLPNKMLR